MLEIELTLAPRQEFHSRHADPDRQIELLLAQFMRGPPGPPGTVETFTVGAQMLSGHTAVAFDAGGLLIAADTTDRTQVGRIHGVVVNAYAPGTAAQVLNSTTMQHVGWAWAPGPILAGVGGALTQALPVGAAFRQVVGFALAPTIMRVDMQPPIITPP